MAQPHSTASPLARFTGIQKRGNKPVYWGRAGVDGIPILGTPRGSYGPEEFERKMVPSKFFRFQEFDLSQEKDREEYTDVMDKILNGWFKIIHKEKVEGESGQPFKWYLEWYEVYLEDGSLADAMLEHGRGDLQ